MTEVLLGSYRIAVSSTKALAGYIPGFFELRHYPDSGAFGNSDSHSDIAEAHLRIPSQADNDVAVVTEKGPGRCLCRGTFSCLASLVSFLLQGGV
jgi:hypothetical protein